MTSSEPGRQSWQGSVLRDLAPEPSSPNGQHAGIVPSLEADDSTATQVVDPASLGITAPIPGVQPPSDIQPSEPTTMLPPGGLPALGGPGIPAQNGAVPTQGAPGTGVPAQGLPAQGVPAQGLPAQGLSAQGLPAQGGAPAVESAPQGLAGSESLFPAPPSDPGVFGQQPTSGAPLDFPAYGTGFPAAQQPGYPPANGAAPYPAQGFPPVAQPDAAGFPPANGAPPFPAANGAPPFQAVNATPPAPAQPDAAGFPPANGATGFPPANTPAPFPTADPSAVPGAPVPGAQGPGAQGPGAQGPGAQGPGAQAAGAPSRVFGPDATPVQQQWTPSGLVPMPDHADNRLQRLRTSIRGGSGKAGAGVARELSQPVTSGRRIAVLGIRGGSGKSTVASLLVSAYATHRGDRVLAVDADPDLGSLGLRLGANSPTSLANLGKVPRVWSTLDEAERCLGRSQSGAWILSGERQSAAPETVPPNAYLGVIHGISRYFAVTVVDAGAGMVTPLNQAVLADAHAIVLATPASVDGVVSARRALEWIREWNPQRLTQTVIGLTAMSPQAGDIDLNRTAEAFAPYGVAPALLPYDRHLAAGSTIEPWRLGERTRNAAVQLAATALVKARALP